MVCVCCGNDLGKDSFEITRVLDDCREELWFCSDSCFAQYMFNVIKEN